MNNYLCPRNVFQNGINAFSKMVNHFLTKSSQFCIFPTMRFCSNFTTLWSEYLSNNVRTKLRLLMSESVMATYNALQLPVLTLHILTKEVYSLSMHNLIRIWTTCWQNLKQIVWSEMFKQLGLFDKKRSLKKLKTKTKK